MVAGGASNLFDRLAWGFVVDFIEPLFVSFAVFKVADCFIVLGDPVYGPKKPPYPVEGGQLLHAYKIGFVHPSTGEWMCFTAEPEERFLAWKRKLRLAN